MRERTRMDRNLIERLPNLKLIASTGLRNVAIDLEAAAEHGIEVVNTRYESNPNIEFTWAMILGLARKIWIENASLNRLWIKEEYEEAVTLFLAYRGVHNP
jgi:phosphoglycerate dehydrogenase-like enzyme